MKKYIDENGEEVIVPYHKYTIEDVIKWAEENNAIYLSTAIKTFRHGRITFDEAMQLAAILQAERIKELEEIIIDWRLQGAMQ